MDQPTRDGSTNSEFTFDPTNKIIGVINHSVETNAAVRDLRAAGFSANQIDLLTGEEMAPLIVNDEGREVSVHIFHLPEKVPSFYDAPVIARRVKEELVAGHFLVGVRAQTQKRETARARF